MGTYTVSTIVVENVLCEHSLTLCTEIDYVGRHELLECLVCHRLSAAVNMFTALKMCWSFSYGKPQRLLI